MIERIKSVLNYLLSAAVVVLGYLLFNRNRKLQQTEGDLAKERASGEIKENDRKFDEAKKRADSSGDEWERIRRE